MWFCDCDEGELDQSDWGGGVKGGWGGGVGVDPPSSSSSSSLPSAPAGGRGAAARTVSAAGLVLAHFRLRLLATVATVVVAMVLLVERYRSRHAAGHSWY